MHVIHCIKLHLYKSHWTRTYKTAIFCANAPARPLTSVTFVRCTLDFVVPPICSKGKDLEEDFLFSDMIFCTFSQSNFALHMRQKLIKLFTPDSPWHWLTYSWFLKTPSNLGSDPRSEIQSVCLIQPLKHRCHTVFQVFPSASTSWFKIYVMTEHNHA